MSTAKKIISNIFILYIASIIGNLLTLALILFISRFLGADGLGKYSFVLAFVGVFSIFSDFGLGTLMKKDIIKNPENKVFYLGNIITLKFIINLVIVILCLISINFADKSSEVRSIVLIYAFTMFLEYMNWLLCGLYQIYQQIEYQALVIILERIISTVGGIILLLLGYKLMSIFILIFISYLISFSISLYITNKKFCKVRPNIDIGFSRKNIHRALPFWFSGVFLSLYSRADMILLKFLKSYNVVGFYSAAYKLIDGLSFIPAVITIVIFPVMLKFHVEDRKKLQILFQTLIKYLFIISFPIAVGTSLLANRIISLFYGEEFLSSALALQILIWAEILVFINAISGQLLNAIDKEKAFAFAAGFCLVFNVISNIILIPLLSFIGSAIAVLLTQIILGVLFYIHFMKKGYYLNIKNIGIAPVFACFVMMATIYFLGNLNLFLIIPISAAIYFSILFFSKSFSSEEISLFKSIIKLPFLKNPK